MTTKTAQYTPTVHAIERFREYYGIKEVNAIDFANEIMADAHYIMKQPDGKRIYQNDEYDSMIALDPKVDRIITVLPSAEKRKEIEGSVAKTYSSDNVFLNAFQSTVKRELSKARRQFVREYRRITEEIAVIGVDIAQLTLNKARARSPVTQGHIQRKIDDLHAEAVRMDDVKGELEAQFRAMKSTVSEFVGTEVGV